MGASLGYESPAEAVQAAGNEKALHQLQRAGGLMFVVQFICLFLFGFCSQIKFDQGNPGTPLQGYNMFIGVEIMMFIGFGYLMTFLRRYGIGAVAFTMIVVAIGLQWAIFTEAFFHQAYNSEKDHWYNVDISVYTLLNALYAISAVLISFGACIGKLNPLGLVIMTVIEITMHSINYKVLMTGSLKINDAGGTYVDHMFGAYFGLAVAYMLGVPSQKEEGGSVPDVFSLLGTLFLWVYWPSFVAGADTADSETQTRAIVATIISLAVSTVSAFFTSIFLSSSAKFRPVDIQNATLAGGVAIGCVANLKLSPVDAAMVGLASGVVSCLGYNLIQDWLQEKLSLHDTCGVHNLHAMPAVVGALASVFIAAGKNAAGSSDIDNVYMADGDEMWWRQFVAIFVCIGFAISTGLTTGYILQFFGSDERSFRDQVWWELASMHGASSHGDKDKELNQA